MGKISPQERGGDERGIQGPGMNRKRRYVLQDEIEMLIEM